MKVPLLACLLFGVTLSGCFGGNGGADQVEEDATPMLPPGLTMDDAEVVSYNETTVVWKWSGFVSGHESMPLEVAETMFDVPAGLALGLAAEIGREDQFGLGGTVVLSILDDEGTAWCAIHDATNCRGTINAQGKDSRWTVRVEPLFSAGMPFEVILELTTDLPEPPAIIDPADLPPAPTHQPYPDGDEGWPVDLVGPFELGQKLTDPIESHDGTMLETTIYIPELPDGVKAPVVLWSQPYMGGCDLITVVDGGCMEASDSDFIYEGGYARLNPSLLVENGFAVAISNVRGTGHSGGCFENKGTNEQLDQVALVEYLAEQSWSNRHVAMYGHSYHGATPWMAAVNAPEALKTIIASGLIIDPYTFHYTPQGAARPLGVAQSAGTIGTLGLVPPAGGGTEHGTIEHIDNIPARFCSERRQVISEPINGQATDLRDGSFWDERRLIDRFPDVTAAVLVSQGFHDNGIQATGHTIQDDDVWMSLPDDLPKRQIIGQWGHDLPPPPEFLGNAPFGSDWYQDTALPWLDYWLKGVGHPALVHAGTVHYQDRTNDWHETTAWPPTEVRHEVLYLASDGSLATGPQEGQGSFVSPGRADLCAEENVANSLLYVTEPLEEPVMVAGNPWAYLRLESNQPGGIVSLDIGTISGDASCMEGLPVANGAADLRFHEGNYEGSDFPVLEPSPVRIDLMNNAFIVEAGQRLAVGVHSGAGNYQGQPWEPLITIHGGSDAEASHIVIPIVEGTLGGEAPSLDYPSQPFLPDGVG